MTTTDPPRTTRPPRMASSSATAVSGKRRKSVIRPSRSSWVWAVAGTATWVFCQGEVRVKLGSDLGSLPSSCFTSSAIDTQPSSSLMDLNWRFYRPARQCVFQDQRCLHVTWLRNCWNRSTCLGLSPIDYGQQLGVTPIRCRHDNFRRDEVRLSRLMTENRFTLLGAARSAMWWSGKRRNDADGPICRLMETMIFVTVGERAGRFCLWRRCLALVVSNTTAWIRLASDHKSPQVNDPI